MWSVVLELGSWCLTAIAMTLAPRTDRRLALLAVSCLAALGVGLAVRLTHAPAWTPGKVDPWALGMAALAAVLVAIGFELHHWRCRRIRASSAT
ncbi:MAG: hypothetical protein JRI23_29200 [Deltaproteobacteria bacterium]|nr:hypothetical protein [Deltaproteobacteria bacterium]MBW2536216.1 hypothetical protein [Deltaproteobacteria bacterium]